MKTIRTKIFALVTMAMVLCLSIIIGIGITTINQNSDRNSLQIIKLVCQKEEREVEHLLTGMEQSVKMITECSLQSVEFGDIFSSVQSQKLYLQEIDSIMQAVIEGAVGAGSSVYFQFNPEEISSAEGIFYSKTKGQVILSETDRKELFQRVIGEKDILAGGREPVWAGPYENGIIREEVISYIRPVYWNNRLLAIIGMDIPFDEIIDIVDGIRIYKSGYACVMDREGRLIYHPYEEHAQKDVYGWQQILKENHIQTGTELFEYSYEGKSQALAYTAMGNGMYLLVSVPKQEIHQQRNFYSYNIVGCSIVVAAICIYIAWKAGEGILQPLKQFTEAAREIANGNFQVELTQKSNDEIGELSASVQQMVDGIQLHMNKINALAYKDPLTGVRSKAAYKEEVNKLDEQIKQSYEMFGVVVFDVNDLKLVNDMNGHEAGDVYLQNCCKLICQVYEHSPVFRIGGDEFVAFLMGQDLANALQLQTKLFDRMQELSQNASRAEEKVSIASGMSVFFPKGDRCFQDVFKRADEAMYKNKKRIKSGRPPVVGFPRVP